LYCGLPPLQKSEIFLNGLVASLLILLKPLVTASLTNSLTAWNGRNTGSSEPPFMLSYSNARVLVACADALASPLQRALLTAAAAAKAEESIGNVDTTTISPMTSYMDDVVSRKGSLTVVAVVVAQKAKRADVNGRMAKF
jgi:hypothetical protein